MTLTAAQGSAHVGGNADYRISSRKHVVQARSSPYVRGLILHNFSIQIEVGAMAEPRHLEEHTRVFPRLALLTSAPAGL